MCERDTTDCPEQMPVIQVPGTDMYVLPYGESSTPAEERTTVEEGPGVLGPTAVEEVAPLSAPLPRNIL